MLKIYKLVLIFIFLCNSLAFSKGRNIPLSNRQIINTYLKYHKDSFQKTCSGRTDHIAQKLYKNFLGDGTYIPFKLNGELDKTAIKNNLKILNERQEWISVVHKKLKAKRSFRPELGKLRNLKRDFKKLQKLRHQYYLSPSEKNRQIAFRHNKKFVKSLELFLEKLVYFHTFKFPVDHFYLRAEYDKYKDAQTEEEKHIKNEIYMLRKTVEEGAVNKKGSRSDLGLRALINTVYLRLSSFHEGFVNEDLRYDIDSLLVQLESHLRAGRKSLLKKLAQWKISTNKRSMYYQRISDTKNQKSDVLKKLYSDKNKARYALKNYIYSKEADVYNFWSRKSELYRKLFALETILIHEVGRLDNSYGSERRDVAKVVFNRVNNPEYNSIDEDESLYPHLKKLNFPKKNKQFPWLNVLFKEGQFSFTYFFIPASRGIFCADQSRSATRLRKKNLSIILSELKKDSSSFKATRYFSRASMLGRIDMAQLWSDYEPMPQKPGPLIKNSARYKKLLSKKHLNFLYTFIDDRGRQYEVYDYKTRKLIYRPKLKKFYSYRNPHYFTYFVKEESY